LTPASSSAFGSVWLDLLPSSSPPCQSRKKRQQ
jgi:hypothetical protein